MKEHRCLCTILHVKYKVHIRITLMIPENQLYYAGFKGLTKKKKEKKKKYHL